jgi:hypothetical protein
MARPESYKALPSVERLKELLTYDETSGALTWKAREPSSFADTPRRSASERSALWNVLRAGQPAGSLSKSGYVTIMLDGIGYKTHRVIWKMMTGEDPITIDHVSGDRSDNRWENLRDVSMRVNATNKRLYASNKSGVPGVSLHKRDNVWQARINVASGIEVHLGSFDTRAEAVAARIAGEILLSYHQNHGAPDRARYQESPRPARMN